MASRGGPPLHLRRTGTGVPVVLIHGVAGSGLIWGATVAEMGNGFEAIAVDLLGYGYSPKPPLRYTPCRHVGEIHRTIKGAGICEPVVVMGLSMGAILALEFAARYPESTRGVVGVGLPYYRDEAEAQRELRHNFWTGLVLRAPSLARPLITLAWSAGGRSHWLSRVLAPRMYSGEVARESMMASYQAFASTLTECLVRNRPGLLLEVTRQVPMLFLHGTLDRWCPAERVRDLLEGRANCELELIQGAGHNLAVLDPSATAQAATTFLDRLR